MRISDEIDALEVMGVNSVVYLVATRVWAALITMIPLYLAALFASYLASELVVTKFFGLSPGHLPALLPALPAADRHLLLVPQGDDLRRARHLRALLLRLQRHRRPGRGGCGRRTGHPALHHPGRRRQPLHVADPLRWRQRLGQVGRMRRLRRVGISLFVLVVLVAGTITLIRTANGDYSGDYALTGMFPKAGEGLHPGSSVVFRGVQVGRVSDIALKDNEAQVKVLMQPNFKVPASATATIEPVNLFGAEQVSISTPDHNSEAGPYLPRNGTFAHAATSDELGDLFAAATPLLQKINTRALSTVLGELGQASQGEGPQHRRLHHGRHAAGRPAELHAELAAATRWIRSPSSLRPSPPTLASLNSLNAEVNAGLPTFNAEEANYEKLLNTLIPFANDLASLLATYHPDIATILTAGDNVSRVLLAQQDNIGQVVQGAYHYFVKIAEGAASLTKLPDGSTYVYFNTFILFSDVNSLVCSLIAPTRRPVVPGTDTAGAGRSGHRVQLLD